MPPNRTARVSRTATTSATWRSRVWMIVSSDTVPPFSGAVRSRLPGAAALGARAVLRQDLPQVLPGVRRDDLGHGVRRPLGHDLAAGLARLGPEVDDPVGRSEERRVGNEGSSRGARDAEW